MAIGSLIFFYQIGRVKNLDGIKKQQGFEIRWGDEKGDIANTSQCKTEIDKFIPQPRLVKIHGNKKSLFHYLIQTQATPGNATMLKKYIKTLVEEIVLSSKTI